MSGNCLGQRPESREVAVPLCSSRLTTLASVSASPGREGSTFLVVCSSSSLVCCLLCVGLCAVYRGYGCEQANGLCLQRTHSPQS